MSQAATENIPTQAQQVEVNEAALSEVADRMVKSGPGQIDLLLDTPMAITVRLGQAELLVRDLLQMGAGSVVKLDKRAGDPVELYLRGSIFARGQLVVVGEQLGVRITELVPKPPEGEGKS